MTKLSDVARHIIAPEGICSTAWPAVRETCAELGITFDEWQDGLGRLTLAKRSDGLYAADICAWSIARQVGKTYLLGAIAFALCIREKTLAIWTAHRNRTAAETFRAMQAFAQRPNVKPYIANVVRGAGNEAIEFSNGSRLLFGARERGFGRGFAGVDLLIFDEAQILSDNAMDDMLPTTNAAYNPLIILAGTPPKPSDPGEVFTVLRQEALDGESADIAYVEISADRGSDPLDRRQWRKMNPSYPDRTNDRAILRLHKTLTEDSFRREAMGIWDEYSRFQPVIRAVEWQALRGVAPNGERPDAIGVDMSHGREISIAACWMDDDGHAHAEEVWAGPDAGEAILWLTTHVNRRTPIVIDGASPAAALIPELQIRRMKVNTTTAGDMARACGLVVDRVSTRTVTHGDQISIDEALHGARKRPIRDAGGWGWDRRDDSVNIAPLVAFTLALFGATTTTKLRTARREGGRSTRGRGAFVL